MLSFLAANCAAYWAARDAWNNIWASSTFWIERAPRRLAAFATIGLLAGILYSFIWPSLLRKLTAAKDR